MGKRGVIAGTFLLFAAAGAAYALVVSSGLWRDRQMVFAVGTAVSAVGLAAGLLGRRLFFFMKNIEDGPVLLARQADAVAACMTVGLVVIFLLPVFELMDAYAGVVAVCGVGFLGWVYAGVCLGVSVEYAGRGMAAVAGAFIAGLGGGVAAGFLAGSTYLPQMLLGCAACAAVGSLAHGAGHRRGGKEADGWKEGVLRAIFVAGLCVMAGLVLVMVDPVITRAAREGKGLAAFRGHDIGLLVGYMKGLRDHVFHAVRLFFAGVGAVALVYVIAVAFARDSKKFVAWHDGVKHVLVSAMMLVAMVALLFLSVRTDDFAKQYKALEEYQAAERLGSGEEDGH